MSFLNKISNAINKTVNFLEEMEEAPKRQAWNDGYNDYMNGKIKCLGLGVGCSYSDSMVLNKLYADGAYKASYGQPTKKPASSSIKSITGNTRTYRDKYGNISGTSIKNGNTITYRDRDGNISGTKTIT